MRLMALRAQRDSMCSRRLSDCGSRPLSFTVRGPGDGSCHYCCDLAGLWRQPRLASWGSHYTRSLCELSIVQNSDRLLAGLRGFNAGPQPLFFLHAKRAFCRLGLICRGARRTWPRWIRRRPSSRPCSWNLFHARRRDIGGRVARRRHRKTVGFVSVHSQTLERP